MVVYVPLIPARGRQRQVDRLSLRPAWPVHIINWAMYSETQSYRNQQQQNDFEITSQHIQGTSHFNIKKMDVIRHLRNLDCGWELEHT